MNEHIEQRLRTAQTGAPAPTGLTDRLRHAVRDEPQIPDHHGFELRRIGPIAAAILIGCALLPFLVGPPVEDRRAFAPRPPELSLAVPLETLATTLNDSYAEELDLIRGDVEQISASMLRSWRPLARR